MHAFGKVLSQTRIRKAYGALLKARVVHRSDMDECCREGSSRLRLKTLMQIPGYLFPGIAWVPGRQVCGDRPVLFLGRSNHLPIDSGKAGLDAIDIVSALYSPPGEINEAIIDGTAGKRACKNRVCRVFTLLGFQVEIEGEDTVALPFSWGDIPFGVLQPEPVCQIERIGGRNVIAAQQAEADFIRGHELLQARDTLGNNP
jgi:hypothetical protein